MFARQGNKKDIKIILTKRRKDISSPDLYRLYIMAGRQ